MGKELLNYCIQSVDIHRFLLAHFEGAGNNRDYAIRRGKELSEQYGSGVFVRVVFGSDKSVIVFHDGKRIERDG